MGSGSECNNNSAVQRTRARTANVDQHLLDENQNHDTNLGCDSAANVAHKDCSSQQDSGVLGGHRLIRSLPQRYMRFFRQLNDHFPLLAPTINGCTFWWLLFGIGPMIWFWPLNAMEVTGYEAFVVFLFVPPLLMDLCWIRQIALSTYGNVLISGGMLMGIVSYQLPSNLLRLIVLSMGAGWALLKFVRDLLPERSWLARRRSFWGYTLGFHLGLVGSMGNISIAVAWSSATLNAATALAFCFSATLHCFREDQINIKLEKIVSAILMCGTMLPAFTNVSLLPVVFLSFSAHMTIYFFSGWSAFLGVFPLGIGTMMCWSAYANLLVFLPDKLGRIIGIAMFTYLVQMFFSVWTVAYNFVPGGMYTREFTSLNICVGWAFIFMGLFFHRDLCRFSYLWESADMISATANSCRRSVVKTLLLFFLIASVFMAGRHVQFKPSVWKDKLNKTEHLTAMVWTFHFGYDNLGWPSLWRAKQVIETLDADIVGLLETDASKPFMGNKDLTSWLSENLNMYADFGPSTKDHTWGSVLLSRYPIEESTHHLLPSPNGELAPAISALVLVSQNTYIRSFTLFCRNVFVSTRAVYVKDRLHHLFSLWQTLTQGRFHSAEANVKRVKSSCCAKSEAKGRRVGVIVTHMGNDRDDEDRRVQAEYLSDLAFDFHSKHIPVIFLGYVTSLPHHRDYQQLRNHGHLKDIDSNDLDRFCEYILYNGLQRRAYARISHASLTDTEIQAARFSLLPNLPPAERLQFGDHEPRTRVVIKVRDANSIVDQSVLWPEDFGGFYSGHFYGENHRYHMNTPKYFVRI